MITLNGDLEKSLTIRGSDAPQSLTIAGYAGALTIYGDSQIENLRTDCTLGAGVATDAYCNSDTKTIDASLGDGGDELGFNDNYEQHGVTVIARGAAGPDALDGTAGDDDLDGGQGGDKLRGKAGDDDLDGGQGRDACNGGSGQDHIRNCE